MQFVNPKPKVYPPHSTIQHWQLRGKLILLQVDCSSLQFLSYRNHVKLDYPHWNGCDLIFCILIVDVFLSVVLLLICKACISWLVWPIDRASYFVIAERTQFTFPCNKLSVLTATMKKRPPRRKFSVLELTHPTTNSCISLSFRSDPLHGIAAWIRLRAQQQCHSVQHAAPGGAAHPRWAVVQAEFAHCRVCCMCGCDRLAEASHIGAIA